MLKRGLPDESLIWTKPCYRCKRILPLCAFSYFAKAKKRRNHCRNCVNAYRRVSRLRHAAALALVGWYLMLPPMSGAISPNLPSKELDTEAPLASWQNYRGFDTAKECDRRWRIIKRGRSRRTTETISGTSMRPRLWQDSASPAMIHGSRQGNEGPSRPSSSDSRPWLSGAGTLLVEIAIRTVLALQEGPGWTICSNPDCGRLYRPRRQVPEGRLHFCRDCGKRASWRLSKRRKAAGPRP